MQRFKGELTAKHRKAVELLAKGFSTAMVAGALDVGTMTILNWKKRPDFKKELAEAINLRAEASNYKLHDLYRKALEECEGLMQDKNAHIRLGAARLVCESYAALVRSAEEKALIEQIEERMEQLTADAQTGAKILAAADDTIDAEFSEQSCEQPIDEV